jgi:hypothetical protein
MESLASMEKAAIHSHGDVREQGSRIISVRARGSEREKRSRAQQKPWHLRIHENRGESARQG